MTHPSRLLYSKLVMSLMLLVSVWPQALGETLDRAIIYWLLSIPVFIYVLWSKLHGSGRSIRIVGLLGIAYIASFYLRGDNSDGAWWTFLLIGFALGIVLSIKRPE